MATIIGTIKKPDGNAFVGEILFRPITTPLVNMPELITTKDVLVQTGSLGNFSVNLQPGRYSVKIPDSKSFRISVPRDSNTYSLISRACDDLFIVCEEATTSLCTPATSDVLGCVLTDVDDPSPVAVLGWFVFATLAVMKAQVTKVSHKVALLMGSATEGDTSARFYRWWSASTAVGDDDTIIRPTDVASGDPGRWVIFMG